MKISIPDYKICINKHREDKSLLVVGIIATLILFVFSFCANGDAFKIKFFLMSGIIIWIAIAIVPYVDYWMNKRNEQ